MNGQNSVAPPLCKNRTHAEVIHTNICSRKINVFSRDTTSIFVHGYIINLYHDQVDSKLSAFKLLDGRHSALRVDERAEVLQHTVKVKDIYQNSGKVSK